MLRRTAYWRSGKEPKARFSCTGSELAGTPSHCTWVQTLCVLSCFSFMCSQWGSPQSAGHVWYWVATSRFLCRSSFVVPSYVRGGGCGGFERYNCHQQGSKFCKRLMQNEITNHPKQAQQQQISTHVCPPSCWGMRPRVVRRGANSPALHSSDSDTCPLLPAQYISKSGPAGITNKSVFQ